MGGPLTSLLYADDVAILADSAVAMRKLIQVLEVYCAEWRMSVNLEKTNIMRVTVPNQSAAAPEILSVKVWP